MNHLYNLITVEERAEWTDLRGEEWKDYKDKLREKYLGHINGDFDSLHPDNKRRIRQTCEILDTICENLLEYGDVWLKDAHDLDRRRIELHEMMQGQIERWQEEVE